MWILESFAEYVEDIWNDKGEGFWLFRLISKVQAFGVVLMAVWIPIVICSAFGWQKVFLAWLLLGLPALILWIIVKS